MIITNQLTDPRVIHALRQGQLVVLRTDTIYGIVALTTNPAAVAKLYAAKHRTSSKSSIVLVSTHHAIPGLTPDQQRRYIAYSQQRPTTVITPAGDMLAHLPHQDGTLAFRAVPTGELASLVQQTGPLLAPSANPADQPPAKNIAEAIDYFGDAVSVYVDGGEVTAAQPSRIIRFDGGDVVTLRD